MFDTIVELRQQRADLQEQLDDINAKIQAEFTNAEKELSALRDELAPHGRDTAKRAYVFAPAKNKAAREAQSKRMKAAWALKKANGQPWSTPLASIS